MTPSTMIKLLGSNNRSFRRNGCPKTAEVRSAERDKSNVISFGNPKSNCRSMGERIATPHEVGN